MKNVCAVSSFMQTLLTRAYHFDEHSFPSISFQKKVRLKERIIYISLGFQSLYRLHAAGGCFSVSLLVFSRLGEHLLAGPWVTC